MAWCRLADSHNPNRSPEQCLQTQSYVIIRPRLKLVNFTTLLLAQTVNGTGRPGTQRLTGHCVSVSGSPAAQRPTGHCVAGHPGTQRPIGHCVAGHPGTQWWTGHCVAGHPGTQRSTAHCVAGTRVHSIVLLFYPVKLKRRSCAIFSVYFPRVKCGFEGGRGGSPSKGNKNIDRCG